MKVMLDTNICIYIIKKRPEPVLQRFQDYEVGDVALSAITLSELCFGAAKSQNPEKNADALEEFLLPLEILPFGEEAAQVYGGIRASLERSGEPIGAMDMLIAAHAVSAGLTLITHNSREFARIPGLSLQDWV